MRLVLLAFLSAISVAFAEDGVVPTPEYATPAFGQWRGLPAGTYTIHHQISRFGKDPKETYEKDLLLGAGKDGEAVFQHFTSDAATGPWKASFGHADVPPGREKGQRNILPDEKIVVDGQAISCSVEELTKKDDWGTFVSRSWKEKETGLVLQLDRSFDGQDGKGQPSQSKMELRTTGRETRAVAGRSLDCYVQEAVETGGRLAGRRRVLVNPNVPGGTVTLVSTTPGEAEPRLSSELIECGRDVSQLAQLRSGSSYFPAEKKPSAEDLASQQAVVEAKNRLLTDFTSSDPERIRSAARTAPSWRDSFTEAERIAVLDALRKILAGSDPESRRLAAGALGAFGERGLTPRLVELLAADPDGAPAYVEALGQQGDSAALSAILGYLAQGPENRRRFALSALKHFKAPEARLAAEKALVDRGSSGNGDGWEARSAALGALEAMGDPASLPVLVEALSDPSPLIVRQTIPVVAKLGSDAELPALLSLLKAPDQETRMSVCVYVGMMQLAQPGVAGQALLPFLDDPAPEISASAASAMARLRIKAAIPKLLEIASRAGPADPPSWFMPRLTALAALGEIGDPSAIPGLITLLDSPDGADPALEALLKINDPAAAQPLYDHWRKTLENPPATRAGVSYLAALGQLGTARTRSDLAAFLETCPPPLKASVRQAVAAIDRRLGS